eukprot:TRINITY_DN16798_c0_g1_i1.p1 TRINITY_DN16798_c0_g1~~TRINITY_DN16798_c0_g1_i1.p1  ORF type:complete len:120 (+),score=19.68 TRINITY_DN16798_c0_g1_i1:30-362(+)
MKSQSACYALENTQSLPNKPITEGGLLTLQQTNGVIVVDDFTPPPSSQLVLLLSSFCLIPIRSIVPISSLSKFEYYVDWISVGATGFHFRFLFKNKKIYFVLLITNIKNK